jgi:MFS family permease
MDLTLRLSVFGVGTLPGPICGPILGGWLTYDYNWRWVFYINLPVGLIAGFGALIFMREMRQLALGLRSEHPKDLLQCPYVGT